MHNRPVVYQLNDSSMLGLGIQQGDVLRKLGGRSVKAMIRRQYPYLRPSIKTVLQKPYYGNKLDNTSDLDEFTPAFFIMSEKKKFASDLRTCREEKRPTSRFSQGFSHIWWQ